MIREVKFESQDRRIKQILAALNENGIKDIEEANAICESYGLDPYKTCEETQPICFENAKHLVSSRNNIAAKLPCPIPTLRSSATEPGIQNACNPMPIASAASAAFLQPFFNAIAAPTT